MRLGRLCIAPSFVLLIGLFLLADRSIYTVLVIAAAALHEAGHLRALRLCGVGTREIILRAFGIEIVANGLCHLPYQDEAAVAFAGPLANILAALATAAIVLLTGPFDGALFFLVANLALAALNLMPIPGLDGGRILSALLLQRMELQQGERICRAIGLIASAAVLLAGVWLLAVTRYNFSLAMIGCYLLTRKVLEGGGHWAVEG